LIFAKHFIRAVANGSLPDPEPLPLPLPEPLPLPASCFVVSEPPDASELPDEPPHATVAAMNATMMPLLRSASHDRAGE
jgi:hypothetical protein